MAGRAPVTRALSHRELEGQLRACGELGTLPYFVSAPADGAGTVLSRTAAYVLRLRPGGYMLVLPDHEDLLNFFHGADSLVEQFAFFQGNAAFETPRGRRLHWRRGGRAVG